MLVAYFRQPQLMISWLLLTNDLSLSSNADQKEAKKIDQMNAITIFSQAKFASTSKNNHGP